MLYSLEEILAHVTGDSWDGVVVGQLKRHTDYLASEDFQIKRKYYDNALIELIDDVLTSYDAPAPAPAPAPAKTKTNTTKKAPVKPKAKDVAIDLAAAKAAGFKIKNADDLTVIEGIGPKINDLFKQNGLKTFADVASATVPQMRKILDAGGARFRIANPSTWAKQAKLAANNKWTELKKLQDELSGGVKK